MTTHYEVLGVDPSATTEDIRAAYLRLARALHPDTAEPGTENSAVDIAQVNAAWEVLRDPDARARYDREVGIERRYEFVPIDPDDPDDDWFRYTPDVGDPRTAPGGRVLAIPIVAAAVAVLAVGAWLLIGHQGFLVAAVVAGVGSLIGFVAAPMVAMARAARYERQD
jgi:hypothetical protein